MLQFNSNFLVFIQFSLPPHPSSNITADDGGIERHRWQKISNKSNCDSGKFPLSVFCTFFTPLRVRFNFVSFKVSLSFLCRICKLKSYFYQSYQFITFEIYSPWTLSFVWIFLLRVKFGFICLRLKLILISNMMLEHGNPLLFFQNNFSNTCKTWMKWIRFWMLLSQCRTS